MKLRQLPEDFRVEEITSLSFSKEEKDYKVYLLEKNGLETFSLVRYLSKQNNIPTAEFGIAGLKDRHAITRQYISLPSKYGLKALREKNFSISFVGYIDRQIRLGDLDGNRFDITVRDVKKGEIEGAYQKAKNIAQAGVPNYFDSQRFGSVINRQFIARLVMKKDYEGAARAYLTQYTRFESRKVKEEKRKIAAAWQNIESIEAKGHLAAVINEYKKSRSWLDAYLKIPRNIREMIVSAYQSYLWNECIKKILRMAVGQKMLYPIKYNIGSLLFYKSLTDDETRKIPKTFKTISQSISPTPFEKGIIDEVLGKEGVMLEEFDIKKDTGNFFKVHDRDIIIKPSDFKIAEPEIDEINDKGKSNRFKVRLSFTLPKGSYATIVTKRIFNK
jgi:tRNA pseudouridine13 synthase